MKNLIKIFGVFLLCAFTLISAQKKDYSNEPGFIDFGDISAFEDGEHFAEIILEEHLLRMVAKLSKHEDEELAELIGGLKLIKVNVFESNPDNQDKIEKKIKSVEKQLKGKDWDRIITAKSKGERALVYIKTEGEDDIVGLVVTAYQEDDTVAFVNIVGKINLETIGRLSDKFDIPSLNDIHD